MKKTLTLLLALALCLGLATPAFADMGYVPLDTSPEWLEWKNAREEAAQVVEDYRAAHPGELEALDLDALLAVQGYREPLAAYMADNGCETEEEARTELLRTYVVHRNALAEVRANADAYRAADPESWENFDADSYFAAGLGSWYGKESYMADNWLFTDEEFADRLYAEYMTWGSLSTPNPWPSDGSPILMVNGASREDIALTAEDGVSYLTPADAQTLFGGDYAGDRVPLRAAAEEAGWDVVWNAAQNQIVLMNQDQLFQDLGLDFSGFDALMNRVLSLSAPEPGQSYRTTQTAKLSFTAFNTLDGDKGYTATVKTDMVSRDNVYDLTLTVKCADLLGLVPPAALNKLTAELPTLTLKDLTTLLNGLKLRVLLDLEAGTLAWNCPFLAVLDETLSEDAWYTLDLGASDSPSANPALDALASGTWDTGAFLYADLLRESEEGDWGAYYAYYNFTNATSILMLLFGPGTVTEKDGGITWSMDAEAVNDMLAQLMTEMSYDQDWSDLTIFKEYDMSISIDKNGKTASSMTFRLDMDALAAAATAADWYDAGTTAVLSWVFGLLDFRMASQSAGTAAKSSGTAEFHWKNQCKLEIETTSTRKETNDLPLVLPSNAKIIPSKLLG